jgi:dipeptidyl aminopeptidase/acylaminoacyl peptidase
MKPLLASLLIPIAALAAPQPPAETHPVEDYFRLPLYSSPTLSRDGKYLAALIPVGGRMSLAVVDLETRNAKALASFDDFDVIDLHWVGSERLVFSLGQYNSPTGAGEFDGGGLFSIRRDGEEFLKLSPTVRELRHSMSFVYRGLRYVRGVPGSGDEIVAAARELNIEAADLYRVDLRTGKKTLLSLDRPERVEEWIVDGKLVPRIAVSNVRDTTQFIVYYRASGDARWEELWRFDPTQPPMQVPLDWDEKTGTLLVASNAGRKTMGVFRYDSRTRQLGELVAQHPRFDMGADARGGRVPGPLLDPESGALVGFAVEAERRQTAWIDESLAGLQKAIDAALPNTVNVPSLRSEGRRVLVTSYSDTAPAQWYLYDKERRSLEELFASRPWFKPEDLVEMKPFRLKTRDGLEILSYYFLPRNRKAGERLPTIIDIHGGPMVRADIWGQQTWGVREAQLLASRGYAVVLPNYRITPGLGSDVYYAGFGTIGRQMSEDHEDAAAWAVREGIADPSRICILGSSYGGYATLRALAKTPDLFRCGAAGMPVSDFELQLYSTRGFTVWSDLGVPFWKRVLGFDPKDAEANRSVSPAYQAESIRAPVFLAAGADDRVTPLEQTTAMKDALERANKPVIVMIKPREGHGFGRLENLVEEYGAILDFFDRYIGHPRPARAPGP